MSERQNWQSAFLKQARADWEAYQKTSRATWAACHRLQFLQMAAEKLGKAFLVAGPSSLETTTQSHAAFVKFLRIVSNNRKLKNALGKKRAQQRKHFNQLLPLAYEIELLAPALAQSGPNPEYPWKDASGNVLAPGDYSFQLFKQLQKTRQGIQLLKHIDIFLKRFEELFM